MSNATCFCGSVKARTPDESLWSAHCHCSMCQRAHGAAFVTWVGYDASKVELTGDSLEWYASSKKGQRGFCRTCGTTLFFRSEQWPGELHIVRSNLDQVDREPSKHAYTSTRVDWYKGHDDLPSSP